jgi:hypothetical protein
MISTNMKEQIILGKWTEDELDCLLGESSKINDLGKLMTK